MTFEHKAEHPLPHTSPSHDMAGSGLEASQDAPLENAPFFTDEATFLDAVFGKDGENWRYFVRVLVEWFPWLVERRRQTGPTAPLQVGWRSHLDTDTLHRHYQ